MASFWVQGVIMGVVATIAMDLWALLLRRLAGLPLPNWGMVGRWVRHLVRGQVFPDDIAKAEPVPSELTIGGVFHYAVGIVYGIALALIMASAGLAAQIIPILVTLTILRPT